MSFKAGTRVVRVANIPNPLTQEEAGDHKIFTVALGTLATVVDGQPSSFWLKRGRDALAKVDGIEPVIAIVTPCWRPLSDNDTNGKTFAELKREWFGVTA